jgi:hypothetical protein
MEDQETLEQVQLDSSGTNCVLAARYQDPQPCPLSKQSHRQPSRHTTPPLKPRYPRSCLWLLFVRSGTIFLGWKWLAPGDPEDWRTPSLVVASRGQLEERRSGGALHGGCLLLQLHSLIRRREVCRLQMVHESFNVSCDKPLSHHTGQCFPSTGRFLMECQRLRCFP